MDSAPEPFDVTTLDSVTVFVCTTVAGMSAVGRPADTAACTRHMGQRTAMVASPNLLNALPRDTERPRDIGAPLTVPDGRDDRVVAVTHAAVPDVRSSTHVRRAERYRMTISGVTTASASMCPIREDETPIARAMARPVTRAAVRSSLRSSPVGGSLLMCRF
jgi:hypothetical protein